MNILKNYRSSLVISVLLMVDHFKFLDTAASVVKTLATFRHRCVTRLCNSATTHAQVFPVSPCLIDLPLRPVFCVVNTSLKIAVELL